MLFRSDRHSVRRIAALEHRRFPRRDLREFDSGDLFVCREINDSESVEVGKLNENPFRRTMLAAFAEIAELERTTIVARVRAGLQAARKRGVELGPPRKITDELRQHASELRQQGKTIRSIAQELQLSTGSVSKLLRPVITTPKAEERGR